MFNNNTREMKTNEPKEEKKKKSSKTKKALIYGAIAFVGGVAGYYYAKPEARQKAILTGKRIVSGTRKYVSGMFKKKETPCNKGVFVIKETFVPEITEPKFEQARRHRKHENNWKMSNGRKEVTNKLNVNK